MTPLFTTSIDNLLQTSTATLYGQGRLLLELVAHHIAQRQPVVIITSNANDFSQRLKNVRFMNSNDNLVVKILPADERTVMHATAADPLIRAERIATRFYLATHSLPPILIATKEALIERFSTTADLQKHAQILSSGETINRDVLLTALMVMGYTKVNHVVDRNTFAVRGSIIDIFINGEKHPVRIDLFGDQIESLRYFDESTQRSGEKIDNLLVGLAKEIFLDDDTKAIAEEKLRQLADQLNYPTQKLNEKLRDIDNNIHFYGMEKIFPAFLNESTSLLQQLAQQQQKPVIIFDDHDAVISQLTLFADSIQQRYSEALVRGDLVFAPNDYFLPVDDALTLLTNFQSVDVQAHNIKPVHDNAIMLPCRETENLRQEIVLASAVTAKDETPHLLKPLADRLRQLHAENITVVISVSSREHEDELKRLLSTMGLNIIHLKTLPPFDVAGPQLFLPHVHAYSFVTKYPLSFGTVFDFLGLAFIAEDDIFGKRTKRKSSSGKQQGFKTAVSDLSIDDLVVHVDFGVGQFKGLVRLTVRGVDNDYVLLNYANNEKLYLPVHRINLIKPHSVIADANVRLDKLGSTTWSTKKTKVKEAVMSMAQDLLKLYAKREIVERAPFIAPEDHYLEFEANFEFETTHDQQKAIDDVIKDMQAYKPMDRLVCGDVGYGKTEVAMRAAMIAALSERQVAVLAPTTVLAQQHGITFTERFKNTGVTIAVLSRFQKKSEIAEVLHKVKLHQIDIVIGTHRLLSTDVQFKNLGLIVVDEEQRFGIKAKEHLKKMRAQIDVLTMSATPIPRTMQMSYFGIRDLSIIETPPVDRLAIETQVAQFDDAVIQEAIMRELARGGQVYFVHNRVQSIAAMAEYLRLLIPTARIEVAHGQMNESDLESIMLRFMSHEINVLVCTTIIETGIDVASANTMFINDADDFGLSQLYQLRGRIGRSKERAFCYLLVKHHDEISTMARTRLDILHKFSDLGVGFRIAQHDLELRGAGDLLGKNQHGHMAAVGYDLYAELLKEAVLSLKGQKDIEAIEPEVILPMSALLSEKYCPQLHERMAFYQRLASAQSAEKIDSIMYELEDLYGPLPQEVLALKISALIKLELKEIFALKLELSKGNDEKTYTVAISLSERTPIHMAQLQTIMKSATPSLRVTPQHKVLLSIGKSDIDEINAAYVAMQTAITTVKRELLKAPE